MKRIIRHLNRNWNRYISGFLILWLLWYNVTMRDRENYCQDVYKPCLDLCRGLNITILNNGSSYSVSIFDNLTSD